MKTFRLLVALLLALPAAIYAQSNFKPAYILKLNGDTLKGYINYREWNITPENIEFKPSLSSKSITKFQPSQISGFGINNIDRYISYMGRISADNNIFPELPSQLDTTTKLDTVFLHLSYTGKPLSLLSQRDNQKYRYFVQENNGPITELKMHQYYNESSQLSTANPYIDVLYQLSNKYNPTAKNINLNIQKTDFVQSDIVRIIKIINSDRSKNTPSMIGTKFFAGVIMSRITTEFKGNFDFSGIPSTSYFPRITGGIDLFTNKYTQKLIWRGELTFSMLKASFKLNNKQYPREYAINQFSASLTPQVLYSFYNTDNFKFYMGAGIGLNLSTYPKNTYTEFSEPKASVQDDYLAHLLTYWTNVNIRAGFILYKKFDINLLYLPPITYSNQLYFSVSSTVYGLGVNYRFGK
ncbi:hypothetical protein [Mucilaginibacter terrae]|uniref:Outer membrane protein beta-barrel domain-containing protein n=1 Tax=Mucilaginibacter terrae TaxID=1955052 RepID=A0ABU3GWI9_9SPHI|nr:hypothetical protein [Mucilaginibacter terrae]MDT3404134.1 hypothetical protein [Mucilaginibacter terrae]